MAKFGNNEINICNNTITNYIKKNKRYPSLEKLMEEKDTGFLFKLISQDSDLIQEFNELEIAHFKYRISTPDKTKMRKELALSYQDNEKLYDEFFLLNLDKNNLHEKRFHDVGEIIHSLIRTVQERVVGNVESGKKYGVYSSSINDKLMGYVKEFFPFYDSVGITIRKAK